MGPAAAGRGADPAPCPSWEDEVRENARRAIFNKAKPERKTARVHPEVCSTPGDFTEQHPASSSKRLGAVSLQEKKNPAPFRGANAKVLRSVGIAELHPEGLRVLFSDEKIFTVNEIFNSKNDRVWAPTREQADIKGGRFPLRSFLVKFCSGWQPAAKGVL